MPPDKPILLGIDLGTTNTCVAYVRNKVARVVPSDKGSLILPSVVAVSDKGDLLVGNVAKDQMVVNPRNTIYGVKHYFSYEIVEGPNGEAAVVLAGKVYSLPQISAFVLQHCKRVAEATLGQEITEAIISVPAYYNDNQRNAVKEAGKLAGFKVKRIVNEPTAAALAYGLNRGFDHKVLVYDLGGGTFDVSVLHLHGNVMEVICTGGDTFLGGVDFDNRIIDYVLEEFRNETKIDLTQSPIAMQRIKNAAESAKIDLSLLSNVIIEL
ncbi:MAG: 2-alkenal reductase, partial [Deltaproteobacteria bacterium]